MKSRSVQRRPSSHIGDVRCTEFHRLAPLFGKLNNTLHDIGLAEDSTPKHYPPRTPDAQQLAPGQLLAEYSDASVESTVGSGRCPLDSGLRNSTRSDLSQRLVGQVSGRYP